LWLKYPEDINVEMVLFSDFRSIGAFEVYLVLEGHPNTYGQSLLEGTIAKTGAATHMWGLGTCSSVLCLWVAGNITLEVSEEPLCCLKFIGFVPNF